MQAKEPRLRVLRNCGGIVVEAAATTVLPSAIYGVDVRAALLSANTWLAPQYLEVLVSQAADPAVAIDSQGRVTSLWAQDRAIWARRTQ